MNVIDLLVCISNLEQSYNPKVTGPSVVFC